MCELSSADITKMFYKKYIMWQYRRYSVVWNADILFQLFLVNNTLFLWLYQYVVVYICMFFLPCYLCHQGGQEDHQILCHPWKEEITASVNDHYILYYSE